MRGNGAIEIIMSLAMRLPILVVAIIGLVMALQRRDKHPRAANYVLIASIGMLLQTIVSMAFYALLPRADFRGDGYIVVLRGANCFFTVLDALFTGLLIAAAFVDRRDPNARPSRGRYDREVLDEPTLVDEESRRDAGPNSTGIRERPE